MILLIYCSQNFDPPHNLDHLAYSTYLLAIKMPVAGATNLYWMLLSQIESAAHIRRNDRNDWLEIFRRQHAGSTAAQHQWREEYKKDDSLLFPSKSSTGDACERVYG